MEQEVDVVEERKNVYRKKYAEAEFDVPGLCRQMKMVQARKEELEAQLKEANAEFDVLRLEVIPQRCEDEGIESMKIEGVGRLSLTGDLYVSVKAGQQVSFFGWLRRERLGDLIKPGVNASTLRAFTKERLKHGKPVPEFLNVTPYTRASITKG